MIIIYLTSYVASDMKRLVTSYFTRYAARGLRPRAAVSAPRSKFFFTKRTDFLPANNLLIFYSLSQINFFILSLPPVVQMQQTNRRCKEEFLHFNIATKICFEKKAFVFQLSCPIKSCFEEAFGL